MGVISCVLVYYNSTTIKESNPVCCLLSIIKIMKLKIFVWVRNMLFHLLLLLSMGAAAVATYPSIQPANLLTAANTTKPGCQRTRGDLVIPYPFGIGLGCYMSSWFGIECNTSYNPPRAIPLIGLGSRENHILHISETQVTIRNTEIASRCYDSQGNVSSEGAASFDIAASPFTYSYSSNKLTVIGCDDYATISYGSGTSTKGYKDGYRVGCLALCSNSNELIQGSCSGLGCCQTSIPIGLQSFVISLLSLNNHTSPGISTFQPCAYAFLAGNNFSFRGAPDFASHSVVNRIREGVPIVLDWSVGDFKGANFNQTRPTCSEAKKNRSTYACQSNSYCIDHRGGGYNCQCLSGYEGNPYLNPGCTDVNECAQGTNSPCNMTCVNTPGSYKCYCPSGYYGDGKKSRTGCTKIANGSSTLKKITIGLSIALGSLLLLLIGWWLHLVIKRRKVIKQKAKYFQQNGGLTLQHQLSSQEGAVERIKIFTIDELDKATDHFNENRILGKGGQGTVYKGMLGEGKIVAIKKLKILDESLLSEFINEVVIFSQINHRNIVKLLGCCLETDVPLLIYEFISNGTLFHHIHYPSEDFVITWKMRLQIATDSAAALAYLHSSSSVPVFHRDIKSSNILLDDKYRAKLSDFGTSRSVAIDQTHITTRVLGTFGYLDPEYFQSNQFTEKSDVYSFGVVLVELLTGEKAIRSTSQEDKSLTAWFLSHMENSRLFEIVDSQVLQEGSKEEFLSIASLAKQCLSLDGKRRPTMREVLTEIEIIRSLHLSRTHQQSWPEAEQALTETTESTYDGFSTFSASYLENTSSNLAELPLLINSR